MRTPIPEKFVDVIAGNNGLKLYLDSLVEEQEHTPRSWLYENLEPDVILKKWLRILEQNLDMNNSFERNVFQFDTAQLEKWGPQGGHAPVESLLEDVVLPSFNPPEFSAHPEAFGTKEWEDAIDLTAFELQRAGVHDLYPRTYSRVVDDMRARDTLISNSGWPDFTRRNKPEVKQRAIQDAQNGNWRDYPAILLFRTYNGKTRQVWMFPMSTNIVEGSWFQPLADAIMKSSLADRFFAPWQGFATVQQLVSSEYKDSYYNIAASDFSSTDAHFQLAASEQVLKVLTQLFKPQFADELSESIRHMHTIPLIFSPSEMLIGEHGVSSGSNWTNFIETIFDMIFGYYIENLGFRKAQTMRIPVSALYAIGDDMSWLVNWQKDQFLKTSGSFPEFLEKQGKLVGQEIKAEKTMCEPDKVKSLQRLFQRGYYRPNSNEVRAVYSTIRALKSSVYPERMHHKDWNSDMFCARQFMILENCVDHPLFERFVEFICAGNSHLPRFAQYADHKLDALTRAAKLVPGLNPTYNQEKRDLGLSSFKSIIVAREL
jgi:hypothetical protein